ncbi:hypothetical protein [Actinomycetospora termitidis]|uniref:HIRAN domain-containing protein n=1 Tax=Actinomycetospora termitidis TaxID=3053470 RepID=A0ABT7M8K3_9PSEU|nr:hypothetical protein [Actinomycetospora sp. Odt1-22]MDL5156107.1 hypothetical protein [Actinomycetospora sp. Odt1-22]
MSQTDASDLVRQLNDAAGSPLWWPWVLVASLVSCVLMPFLLLVGLPLTLWVAWKDTIRRTVVVFYDVQDQEARHYQHLVDSFTEAGRSRMAWHVVAAGAVTTTYQHKVNAGASAVVDRLAVSRTIDGPRHLRANIAVPTLSTSRRSLHFLPDRILVRDGRRYADVPYVNLRVDHRLQRFIESGAVPSDGRVVDYTWRFVNKSGGPDRRFKDNRQLPVLEYGRLTLDSPNGYSAVLDFSTPAAGGALHDGLVEMAAPRVMPTQLRPTRAAPPPRQPVPPRPAWAPIGRPAPAPSTPSSSGRHRGAGESVDLDAVLAQHRRPVLRRRRLSADGRVSVVGEKHYQEPLVRVARGATLGYDWDALPEVPVLLVAEPANRHDSRAVRVDVLIDGGSRCIGYLSREDAALYQPHLLRLEASGLVGTCPGRITGGGPNPYGLYLHLAGPDELLIENLPDDHDVLPAERDVTVTREEHHQEVLAAHHHGGPGRTRLLATVSSSSVSAGKYAGDYAIEVRIDGRRVGELTAAMSARYRSLVVAAESTSGPPSCESLVTHGHRGFQIELRMPKASAASTSPGGRAVAPAS